jgi:hypothetical protein
VTIEVRSYRRVFDLERRIYRIDRLRLNPGGVPVRGVVCFLAILLAALLAGRLPLLAVVARTLPWYLRDLALPAASAAALTVIRVEGRPFHLAAHALLRYRIEPRRLTGVSRCGSRHCPGPGGRWRMEEILMLPDGSDSGLRRLRYTGPGAVLVTVAHEHVPSRWRGSRGPLILRTPSSAAAGRDTQSRGSQRCDARSQGCVIALAADGRMLVRADTAVEGVTGERAR